MIISKYNTYINKFNQLLSIRDLTDNTIKTYNLFLIQYLTWVDSNHNKSIEQINYDDIRIYILYLKNIRKLAPTSINTHISQLKFFYNYVINKPLDKYQIPFMRTTRKLPVIVSKEEIIHFINSFSNLKHKAIAALLYSSGIRISELIHLKYEDISRKNMMLHIRKSKSRTARYALLSKLTLIILTDYWYSANKPRGILFPSTRTGGFLCASTIQAIFRQHSNDINFPIKLTPHLMRHHFGTHLYEEGNDLLTIQKLLGHKSIDSTTLYVNLANPNKLNIVSPFDSGNSK